MKTQKLQNFKSKRGQQLPQSLYQVVLQMSFPAQIRQSILHHKQQVDEFVRKLTFAKTTL
jgi:hypothetical protein